MSEGTVDLQIIEFPVDSSRSDRSQGEKVVTETGNRESLRLGPRTEGRRTVSGIVIDSGPLRRTVKT